MVNVAAKNLSYVMSECSTASYTLMNGKIGQEQEVSAATYSNLENQVPSIELNRSRTTPSDYVIYQLMIRGARCL